MFIEQHNTATQGTEEMAKYNGHKNWDHWNVSLWLNNDENLHNSMHSWIAVSKNRDVAAKVFFNVLTGSDYGNPMTHTPDGAKYSISAIRAAMRR